MDIVYFLENVMKVLYILKSFALKAGTERVMADKMNYLAEHGYEVVMVTYEQGNHPHAFPLHQSIHHIDLETVFFQIEKYSWLKRFPLFVRMRNKFRYRLQTIIDDVEPDIIISTTYSMKLIDIILSVKTKACHIVESHVACYSIQKTYIYRHHTVLCFFTRLYDYWMLGKVAKADLLITLTNGDAKDWLRFTSKVKVIPNPVTLYPKVIKNHDGRGHRIICVGRLNEQKGFDLLIDAFALIASQCEGWTIDIYGDGYDKSDLIGQIRQNNLDSRIKINPPTASIYDEYQSSEFLVLSSRYEGWGLVLVEAMSCGIPCVSFRCKYGPEDVISDRKTGLLVENGNVEDLSNKILWMINHPKERLQMGQEARLTAANFEKNVIMQLWLKLLNQESIIKL